MHLFRGINSTVDDEEDAGRSHTLPSVSNSGSVFEIKIAQGAVRERPDKRK